MRAKVHDLSPHSILDEMRAPQTNMRRLLCLAALVLSLVMSYSFGQDEEDEGPAIAVRTPQLLTVLPMGAQPGSVTAVEISGDALDRMERVVFTTPDVTGAVKNSSFSKALLEVRVAAGAKPGPRYFRLISPRGASNLLLFRVSEWPSIVESEPNNELQDLPLLNWPVLVSGRLGTARDVDLYRFHARAGQRINLNIFAMRNWSTADLSLALLAPNGRAIKQDEGRFIWDPTVSFVSSKDADYLAAVMLTRMPAGGQTGANLVYQLAIGDVPILLSAFPFFRRSGDPINLRVRGEYLPAKTN